MEFNEKLQELRKRGGLTQEALAEKLYVSRTAVSKWESGRGYPSIESLKAIAGFFDVTIDELLSGEELLNAAEEDGRRARERLCGLISGALDISATALMLLPLFGEEADGAMRSVSLFELAGAAMYMRAAYFIIIGLMVAAGLITLVLLGAGKATGRAAIASLVLNMAAVLLFILGRQPYPAAMAFIFLAIKGIMPTKGR